MEYCFFLIWAIFIVIVTSHELVGQELRGKGVWSKAWCGGEDVYGWGGEQVCRDRGFRNLLMWGMNKGGC